MKKRIIKVVGNVATIIALIILACKIARIEVDLSTINKHQTIIFLSVASIIWTITNIVGCFPWLQCIYIFCGKKIDYRKVQMVYLKSNILKYIPGNIFQYVGRNKLAVEEQCSHVDVALATVFEQGASAGILLLYSILFVNRGVIDFFNGIDINYFILSTIVVILAIVVGLIWAKSKQTIKISRFFEKVFAKRNIKRVFRVLIYYIIIDLIGPIIYYLMLRILFNELVPLSSLCYLIGVYLFSVLVGLITPGAPGGIGVREVVMISLTNGMLKESTIILIAVLFRVISTVADLLSFIYALFMDKVKK